MSVFMKKFFISILALIISIGLSSCVSENVKLAEEAYSNEDFERVVELLETEDGLSNKTNEMLVISKAKIACDDEKYLDALDLLLQLKDGKDLDFYTEVKENLVQVAIAEADSKMLVDAITLDSEIGVFSKDIIIEGCDNYEYDCFKTLYGMIESLADSELKDELIKYAGSNKEKRTMAFLVGTWEWQRNCETNTRVNNILYKDNLLATVETVGDNEKDYQILKGDVYWKDFVFIDDNEFTCINLCKTKNGAAVECMALGEIDYENDSIHLHLTAPEPYVMVDADRNWIRK